MIHSSIAGVLSVSLLLGLCYNWQEQDIFSAS